MSKAMAKPKDATPSPKAEQRETRDLPLMSREAPVLKVDAGNRSAELIWTTGAAVKRYDWWNDRFYMEVLSLDPAHVRMDRLASGKAPVLNTHGRYELADVLGVVTAASLGDTDGRATIKFSQREDVAPIVQDVADGIICNVSVGYAVHRVRMTSPAAEGDLWRYEVIDWEPQELSLVPIGADAGGVVESMRAERAANPKAQIDPYKGLRTQPCEFVFAADAARTAAPNPPAAAGNTLEETAMTDEEKRAAEAAKTQREAADKAERERIATEARTAERARLDGIREAVTLGGLDEAFARTLCNDPSITPADAGLAVLRETAKRAAANPTRSPRVEGVRDEVDTRRARMADAIILRTNPQARLAQDEKANREAIEAAREYRGTSLIDMAREAIEAAGGSSRGLSRREIASLSLNLDNFGSRGGMSSTSDFPLILANSVNRSLRSSYEIAPRTFEPWTRRATAPDFKQIARTQLSESPAFQAVKEGGEYKLLQFGESAEKYSLAKSGGLVAITWETLINDDLSAFERTPRALAEEAAAAEGDIVYGILSTNAAMSDTVALFHGTHGNLPSAAAITDVTLGIARALMRKQAGLKGRVLNLTPAYLVVGPDKESEALKYTSAQFVAAKSVDVNPAFNTALKVVVDNRISGNKWYLMAEPSRVDTIEYAHLEGEEGLFTETKQGFEVDGLMIKVRHVFAAKAIDHRGMVYNSGA